MRGNAHVRFGRRAGETDRPRGRHRAPVRPHWATQCLDDVRRQVWNDARRAGGMMAGGSRSGLHYNLSRGDARRIAHARYALWKNPKDLTDNQRAKLDWIATTSPLLHRAYLLKEGLRFVFTIKGEAGKQALARWLAWAQRCRIPVFIELSARSNGTCSPSTPPSTTTCPTG
jgi:transposase